MKTILLSSLALSLGLIACGGDVEVKSPDDADRHERAAEKADDAADRAAEKADKAAEKADDAAEKADEAHHDAHHD